MTRVIDDSIFVSHEWPVHKIWRNYLNERLQPLHLFITLHDPHLLSFSGPHNLFTATDLAIAFFFSSHFLLNFFFKYLSTHGVCNLIFFVIGQLPNRPMLLLSLYVLKSSHNVFFYFLLFYPSSVYFFYCYSRFLI